MEKFGYNPKILQSLLHKFDKLEGYCEYGVGYIYARTDFSHLKQGGAEMKRLVRKFGKYNIATLILMCTGLILFLLTPLLYTVWDFDSDIPGMLIFLIGLVMWTIGWIVRKVRSSRHLS